MNKEAFLLGYNRQPEADISKVAFQHAYMEKSAGWFTDKAKSAGRGFKSLAGKGFDAVWNSNLVQNRVNKTKGDAMKKMLPLLFGGAALVGGAGLMLGAGGKKNTVNQTVAGSQTPKNILPQQQGSFNTINPKGWDGTNPYE